MAVLDPYDMSAGSDAMQLLAYALDAQLEYVRVNMLLALEDAQPDHEYSY